MLTSVVALSNLVTQASAMEVIDKKLEIYSKIHMSIDSVSADNPAANNNEGLSVSSNSSRLGFKGELPAGAFKFVYQFEQELFLDEGTGALADRNTFAGLKGSFGRIIVGHHDTPFKDVASKWGIFGDSVGERRAILGAGFSNGNQMNERAKNAIMYEYKTKQIRFQLLTAVDPEDTSDGTYDDNNKKVTSLGLSYRTGSVWIAVGYEAWKQHSKIADGDALRIAAHYKVMGALQLGLIYESINSDTVDEWKRDIVGFNALYKLSNTNDIRIQYLVADDADNSPDTGATKASIGFYHKLDKKAKVYIAYGATTNESNAAYQGVDGGHGDEIKTANGGNPSSVSVGLIYKF